MLSSLSAVVRRTDIVFFQRTEVGDFKDVECSTASTTMHFHFYQMGSEMLVVIMKKMGGRGGDWRGFGRRRQEIEKLTHQRRSVGSSGLIKRMRMNR